MKEFVEIRFKEGESVDDFSMRITGLTNNITILGGNVTEAEIIKKILHVAPEPLEQVAILIETLLDLDNLTVEEVTGHLRKVEQRKKKSESTVDKQGRLLLTVEEGLTCLKIRESSSKGVGPVVTKAGRRGPSHAGRKKQKRRQMKRSPFTALTVGRKAIGPRIVGASPERRKRPMWLKPKKISPLCFWWAPQPFKKIPLPSPLF
jgi:hypothetical protein